ncbi:MAG: Trk system potassium transporter TrkA [Alphaproteobacteria bacterium]
MKFIICGAGQVGTSIARHLAAEENDVVVIDQSPELIGKIGDSLDVQGIVGFASHPEVLERAGAADADMLIAVTKDDEINMVACQVAHSLFNVPTKIARVRHQSYLDPAWGNLFSRDHMAIDVIISPEIEIARAIARRLQAPGSFEMIPLIDGKVRVIGVRCGTDCPLINTPLRQLTGLFPDLNIAILVILRQGRPLFVSGESQMLAGDDVYFAVDSDHVSRVMAAFGHEEPEARRVVIVGAGNIGIFLAQSIEASQPGANVKVVESNRTAAERASQALSRTTVLVGDVLDSDILAEANVNNAETIVLVTNDDEVNVLAALLAKRQGCRRAVALINNPVFGPLITNLGIDVAVSPRAITVSTILQHVRRGRIRSVHSLGEGVGEVIEGDALETSSLVGNPLKDIDLPTGVVIGALVRGEDVIIPRGDTVIKTGDRIVLFAGAEAVKKIEKMFSVRLEYF